MHLAQFVKKQGVRPLFGQPLRLGNMANSLPRANFVTKIPSFLDTKKNTQNNNRYSLRRDYLEQAKVKNP
jgi:hypothetical protein